MCERKILFIASSSILVRCVEAFMALVWPFEWPNVYIPIIPSIIQKGQDMSLILIETCFMPFIVGVSKESLEYKTLRPPKDVSPSSFPPSLLSLFHPSLLFFYLPRHNLV